MRARRVVATAAVTILAATGWSVLTAGPSAAGGPVQWPVDAQVKAKGDPAYSGIEIFGDAEPGQVRFVFAGDGETALFRVRIQNTKFQNNRINVYFDDWGGFIRVIDGQTDVTDQLKDFSYVRKVGPREAFVLKVKVRPEVEGAFAHFHAESLKFPGDADHVVTEADDQVQG